MTIPAQSAIWSFAAQPEKIGSGTFDESALTWYKVRAPRVSAGTVQDQQVFPLELGGRMVPTGSYKQAQFYAGDVDLIPRFENITGWLLYAALGSVTTTTDEDSDGTSVTGLNTHVFKYASDTFSIPWMASRCHIPGATSSEDSGETGFDCKIANLRITLNQMGKMAMRMSVVGRDTEYDNTPSTWTYSNSDFEASESTGDAGRGSFLMGGTAYPAMGATIEISNNLTTPQQEMIVGSFNPDDFVPLTRSVVVRFVYKYENDDLARQALTGTADGAVWSPLPFFVETSGSDYALDFIIEAPDNVPSTNPLSPYRLRVRANKITVAQDGPIELQAGGILARGYTITVLEPGSSSDAYIEVILENGQTSYTWPT